jgi:hypothetical protein
MRENWGVVLGVAPIDPVSPHPNLAHLQGQHGGYTV